MKSKFYVFVVLCFIVQNTSWAQAPLLQLSSNNGTQTYARAFAAASEKLPAGRIPHGVLYDKVAGWAGLDFWQSGDTTAKAHLVQSWWDLENSRINAQQHTFDAMELLVEQMSEQQKIPLLSFNYSFACIDSMAYKDGRMQIVNNELVDAGGVSPYLSKTVTFAGLGIEKATAGINYGIESKTSLSLTNNTQFSVTGFSIRNLSTGTQLYIAYNGNSNISFANAGVNYLQITTHTSSGNFTSIQPVEVAANPRSSMRMARSAASSGPVHELLASDIAFRGIR